MSRFKLTLEFDTAWELAHMANLYSLMMTDSSNKNPDDIADHILGALLYVEEIFNEGLKRDADLGWSLYGLPFFDSEKYLNYTYGPSPTPPPANDAA